MNYEKLKLGYSIGIANIICVSGRWAVTKQAIRTTRNKTAAFVRLVPFSLHTQWKATPRCLPICLIYKPFKNTLKVKSKSIKVVKLHSRNFVTITFEQNRFVDKRETHYVGLSGEREYKTTWADKTIKHRAVSTGG